MEELFKNCRLGYTQNIQLFLFKKNKKKKFPLISIFNSSFINNNNSKTTPNGWLCNIRQPNTLYTLLHISSLYGHTEIVKILIKNDNQLIKCLDRRNCFPLHLAAWNGHLSILEILLENNPEIVNATNNSLQTALHLATQKGHGHLVLFLLKKGADPKIRNANQENSLDIAIKTNRTNLCQLLLINYPELPLLYNYSTISSQSIIYPLHRAAQIGNEDCLKILIEFGFDIKYLGKEGTALHIAAINGNKKALKIFLDNEDLLSSINIKNNNGQTVLELLNKLLFVYSLNNKNEKILSKWEECRNIILKYLSKIEQQNNKDNLKNSFIPNGWKEIPSLSVVTSSSSSMPSTTSIKNKSLRIQTNNSKELKNINFNEKNNTNNNSSDISCCPYQPLPDEITLKLVNNNNNYQNLPKSNNNCLYDNAPLSAAGRKIWQHNCNIIKPNNSSNINSPLSQITKSPSSFDKNEEFKNLKNKEEEISSLPVLSFNYITNLENSNNSSPKSFKKKFSTKNQHFVLNSSSPSPQQLLSEEEEEFILNSFNNKKEEVKTLENNNKQKSFSNSFIPLSSFPSPSPSCSSDSIITHSPFYSMEGNNKINNQKQQLNNNNNNNGEEEEFRWKEIDEMLNSFQRNSFFKPNSSDNYFSSPAIIIKNNLTNNFISSENKIIKWLKMEVKLEEELAFKIGHLLINNGFDYFEFLKGSLNTKFMTEIGIERKLQLNICCHLDEPSFLIKIPNASIFNSIFDWLNSLNLSELFCQFSKENITSIKDLINSKLNREDLEKMGINKIGYISRIIKSIDIAITLNTITTNSSPIYNNIELKSNNTSIIINNNNNISSSNSSPLLLDLTTLQIKLKKGCVRFSAHYLGFIEILNNNSDNEFKQIMNSIKLKANQVNGVPQILLDISISGVNILDCLTQTAIHRHPINQIQIVCQDDLDLNFFSYIFKNDEQNYCHCFCVLTSLIAKEIITTLGEAFNLAYKIALQKEDNSSN